MQEQTKLQISRVSSSTSVRSAIYLLFDPFYQKLSLKFYETHNIFVQSCNTNRLYTSEPKKVKIKLYWRLQEILDKRASGGTEISLS